MIVNDCSEHINTSSLLTGGTIGLFTGLSIISMLETVYWAMKVSSSHLQFFTNMLQLNVLQLLTNLLRRIRLT